MKKTTALISVVAALTMILALMPGVALAVEEGTTTGQFQAGNVAPTVGTISISPSSMTPQEAWTVITVPVTDTNTLADINEVKVTVFYDSVGNDPDAPTTANVSSCAILTWTRGGAPPWAINQGTGTTWAINSDNCSKADDGQTTGNWVFSFKVGKVATESGVPDDWDIYGKATDNATATGFNYLRDIQMNWYGEVTVTGSVNFGSVGLGSANTTCQSPVSTTYISNGDYAEQIKTNSGSPDYAAKWVGTTANVTLRTADDTPGAGEFVLKADDDATITDAVQVTAAYLDIAADGVQTVETGVLTNNNTLWLSLGTSGIPPGTYSGTVYYKIRNR